jgi:hypothetical protein
MRHHSCLRRGARAVLYAAEIYWHWIPRTCSNIGFNHQSPKYIWNLSGMLLAVVGEWSTLVLDSGTDKLGCWMQIKLQGTKQGTLKIYNIYNICKKCIDRAGPATAYAQQWHLLRMAGDKNPNPHKLNAYQTSKISYSNTRRTREK